MFSYDQNTDEIVFEDGFRLAPPYDHPRYQEYVYWVTKTGQSPTIIGIPEAALEVTRLQAKVALMEAGLLDLVETTMQSPATPARYRLAWSEALTFKRNAEVIQVMATVLGLSQTAVDNLFISASQVEV